MQYAVGGMWRRGMYIVQFAMYSIGYYIDKIWNVKIAFLGLSDFEMKTNLNLCFSDARPLSWMHLVFFQRFYPLPQIRTDGLIFRPHNAPPCCGHCNY